jgi:muramoyltetrapeptide carboxypeptidase
MVAVVSPAGPVRDRDAFETGLNRLRRWGLRPEVSRHALETFGFLAGADAKRAADLQAAITAPDVRAIFCTRGGYGVMRILDRIDFAPLRKDPKPIVGFSDVTALLCAAANATGLVSFHGPMVAADSLDAAAETQQRALLFDPAPTGALKTNPAEPAPHTITPGVAEGPLVGGNLAILAALQGTPWSPKTAGAIVFLEDTDEPPYRVDRMLTQLLRARFFEGAAGVVLGDFANSAAPAGTSATNLEWVLHDRLAPLGIPVGFDFPFGHRPKSWTIPFGARARLDAADPAKVPRLSIIEGSTQPRR